MGRRWILARPRGGLNDTLCQIEKCWRFAEKTGRELVIDTKDSGLLLDFHEVFEVREEASKVIAHKFSEELVEKLNKLSAFPADVQGNATTYGKFKDEHDEFYTLPSRQPLKFSLKRDFAEEIVVYEGMGGGVDSFDFLERVSLRKWLVEHVESSLALLPETYASVHIRQSDMKTDFKTLFAKANRRIDSSWQVLVASDSDEVIQPAREIFGESRVIIPDRAVERKGKPLHSVGASAASEERRNRTSEMFGELFALACASDLFFTNVNERTGISGFSRLAAHLVRNPRTRDSLLHNSLDDSRKSTGRTHHVSSQIFRIAEMIRWIPSKLMRSIFFPAISGLDKPFGSSTIMERPDSKLEILSDSKPESMRSD